MAGIAVQAFQRVLGNVLKLLFFLVRNDASLAIDMLSAYQCTAGNESMGANQARQPPKFPPWNPVWPGLMHPDLANRRPLHRNDRLHHVIAARPTNHGAARRGVTAKRANGRLRRLPINRIRSTQAFEPTNTCDILPPKSPLEAGGIYGRTHRNN
jgi:hypothetical protein